MEKILIKYGKHETLVYVIPRKYELFEQVFERAKNDCIKCGDKKGMLEHIEKSLNRNGFKTLNLDSVKTIKL